MLLDFVELLCSMRSGVCIQPVEGKQNSGQSETYIMADNSPSWDTPSSPSSPTISNYNGSGRNADDHNTLETNLEVSTLLLS